MNWGQVQGKWRQMKGDIRTHWGKLTDQDLHLIGGEKDKLIGAIQERYGIEKDEAQRQVEEWHGGMHKENQREKHIHRKAG
jgi:uncharacterized protein YjbJ (UPF0337 family)